MIIQNFMNNLFYYATESKHEFKFSSYLMELDFKRNRILTYAINYTLMQNKMRNNSRDVIIQNSKKIHRILK